MIRFLSINRLAVIEQLDLELGPGLSVLTGETGAGKSILVEAVSLLLGGRATADLIRTGADTATVQAIVETPDGRELIARREISSSGRSRAFLDGDLVTSAALREAMSDLVDLHGQHDHQALLSTHTQLALLDRFAEVEHDRERVACAFAEMTAVADQLAAARDQERSRTDRLQMLEFQRHEIDRVAPRVGEDETLEAERLVVSNAERLNRLCSEGYAALYDDDHAVLARLGQVWKRVGELAQLDPRFAAYLDAREPIRSQLEELALVLRDYASSIDASADRLQHIEDRLAQIERLKRRYGPLLQDVLTTRTALEAEAASLEQSAERIAALEQQLATLRRQYIDSARGLSARRRGAATRFAEQLAERLGGLAMAGVRCTVAVDSDGLESRWTAAGIDRVELQLSPNTGEELRPLSRIVSGGELSRVMLAIKTLASTDLPGKTLIFDEIDAGIGGQVADVVGSRLRSLAAQCQVLAITHLPQVASYGEAHYRVTKHVVDNRTVTRVERLTGNARVEEIGRMMGGREVTDRVLAGARDLIDAKGSKTKRESGGAKGESERAKPVRR